MRGEAKKLLRKRKKKQNKNVHDRVVEGRKNSNRESSGNINFNVSVNVNVNANATQRKQNVDDDVNRIEEPHQSRNEKESDFTWEISKRCPVSLQIDCQGGDWRGVGGMSLAHTHIQSGVKSLVFEETAHSPIETVDVGHWSMVDHCW